MKATVPTGVDLRAFQWPLAGLARWRGHELEQAQARLAVVEREVQRSTDQLAALEASREQQLKALGMMRLDPASHRQVLRYLVDSLRQLERVRGGLASGRERLEHARQLLVDAERRLNSVHRMRESAQADFAHEASRREARLADLAWLVRRAGAKSARVPPREAQPW